MSWSVKNIVLGIGIFIIFMFVLHNGIRAFYPAPEYNQFCTGGEFSGPKIVDGRITVNCTFPLPLQEQERQCYANEGQSVYNYSEQGCVIGVSCNYCNRDFNNAMKEYNKVVFFVALIIGIIILLIGYAILYVEPVGSALMASGVGAIIYGTIANWENLGNLGRFLLLLLALIVLIWIALRINRVAQKGKSRWMFWR